MSDKRELRHVNTLWVFANLATERRRFGRLRNLAPRAFFLLLRTRMDDPPMTRREKLLAYWEWVDPPNMMRYWVSDPLHKLAWWLVNLQAFVSPEGGREDGPISWRSISDEGQADGSAYSLRFHHRCRVLSENIIFNRTYLALRRQEHDAYHSASKILDAATSEARDALQAGDLDAAAGAIERARARLAIEADPGWQEPRARCFAAAATIDDAYDKAKPDRMFAS